MPRALVIQLARLGDLLQTVPAITALKARDPAVILDLLCPAHLSSIGRMIPGTDRVLSWDGTVWQRHAQAAASGLEPDSLEEADRHLRTLCPERYDYAYVLNQHSRATLTAALFARHTRGPHLHGPLDERLSPWAAYVRDVARTRRGKRVHLADVFCGLCGVRPPENSVTIMSASVPLPADLEGIGKQAGPWIGLIVGAGDPERLVPTPVWRQWMTGYLAGVPGGRVVLIGEEQARGQRLQENLSPSLLGRIWDVTGRTTLPQLATILSRCDAVVGADTGPLHLAAAVGTPVIGWYFARARVHETGPYGPGHRIWQAVGEPGGEGAELPVHPSRWPIQETIAAVMNQTADRLDGWSLWTSHCDRWGAYYIEAGQDPTPPRQREALWRELEPALSA